MLNPKLFFYSLLVLALLSCRGEAVWAQFDAGSPPASRAVESWTVDPFMTDEQEQAILKWLQTPCPFQWGPGTTLQTLQHDLATKVPTTIDHRALEEIGIDQEAVLVPGQRRAAPIHRPTAVDPFAAAAAVDPFADGGDDDPFAAAEVAVAEPPWWRRAYSGSGATSRDSAARGTPSVGGRLLGLLDQVGLTVSIRGGQLILTTHERAEQQLCTRVYEVTGLLGPQSSAPGLLMQTIETIIDPDTWEALGGSSTMSFVESRQRQSLLISAPITVHWKVQAMLDRLKQ